MPTPRLITEIARQAHTRRASTSDSGGWISGVVQSSAGDLANSYQVALDNGKTVSTRTTVETELSVGSRVWVVNADGQYLIVGEG